MSDEREIEKHESYGMIGFSRVSSNPPANFFGSSIRSGHYISLTIRRAERHRSLSQYWYHGREEVIRLRLSPNQFAELLTTLNVGDGVPCTLERIGKEGMEKPPSVDQREKYQTEFTADVRESVREAENVVREIKTAFEKPSLGKRERESIAKQLDMLVGHIRNGMPFIQSQFNEAMDKTVAEAKGEVEAFVNHKVHSLGIQALNAEVLQALEAPLESEPFLLTEAKD